MQDVNSHIHTEKRTLCDFTLYQQSTVNKYLHEALHASFCKGTKACSPRYKEIVQVQLEHFKGTKAIIVTGGMEAIALLPPSSNRPAHGQYFQHK